MALCGILRGLSARALDHSTIIVACTDSCACLLSHTWLVARFGVTVPGGFFLPSLLRVVDFLGVIDTLTDTGLRLAMSVHS